MDGLIIFISIIFLAEQAVLIALLIWVTHGSESAGNIRDEVATEAILNATAAATNAANAVKSMAELIQRDRVLDASTR